MSLASYSPTFVNGLKAGAKDPATFTSDAGYMGQSWKLLENKEPCTLFDVKGCAKFSETLALAGFQGLANLLLAGKGQWQDSIEKDVFFREVTDSRFPYFSELGKSKLSDDPHSWATGKEWILAGTFLTESPALTYTVKNKSTYVGIQTLKGSNKSWPDYVPGGVPVMMTGDSGTNFLPNGDITLTYTSLADTKIQNPTQVTNKDMNSVIKDMKVIHAAGISSAAGGGFIDIPNLEGKFGKDGGPQVATALNGFAPAYQMDKAGDPAMHYLGPVRNTFDSTAIPELSSDLQRNKVVRMADGGFMDNTAVAQMLRHLQDESGKSEVPSGFNIVAFDDFPDTQTKWSNDDKTPMPTGNDIASLFGFVGCTGLVKSVHKECHIRKSGQKVHTSGLLGFKFTGTSPQVFSCDGYFENDDSKGCTIPDTKKLFWQATEKDEKITCGTFSNQQPLTYAKYEVTVRDDLPGSKLWGLKTPYGGAKGTLHVFSILGKGAPVVPNNKGDMTCYAEMVDKIVKNVSKKASDTGQSCDTSQPRGGKNQCTLGDYLEAALN